jgi:nucleotide-binding universal stress UspA family protein
VFRKVLLCVDDSTFSEKVAGMGVDVARRFHAEVIVLSVLDPSRFAEPPYSGLEASQMIDSHSRSLTSMANRVSLTLDMMKIPNRIILLPGKTAQTIIEVAQRENIDLIVMGGEAKGRIRSWLEGNLWSEVSRSAPCNVLRVNPGSDSGIFIPPGRDERIRDQKWNRQGVNPIGDALS